MIPLRRRNVRSEAAVLKLRPEPHGQRSLRPSFSEAPCSRERPHAAFHLRFGRESLRRLLVISNLIFHVVPYGLQLRVAVDSEHAREIAMGKGRRGITPNCGGALS